MVIPIAIGCIIVGTGIISSTAFVFYSLNQETFKSKSSQKETPILTFRTDF